MIDAMYFNAHRTASNLRAKNGGPTTSAAASSCARKALQAPQPDRDQVRSSEGLAPDRDPVRPIRKDLPFRRRPHRNRPVLALTINQSGAKRP
jgi:hypothetical protein